MEHFFELILELLFGLPKNKPDVMPQIEYKSCFIVKHPTKKTLTRICASLILIVVFSLLCIFIKHETRFLFAFFAILGCVLFILSLSEFSFKCTVNEEKLCRSFFGTFQKKLRWKDIKCVRTVENKDDKEVIIALYGHNDRCVMDFNTDMQNAWYIVKMAEQKSIKIKTEKDLSLKQISRL